MSTQDRQLEPVDPAQLKRATLTCSVGSALEYYDFAIYGAASALVFGKVFFPELGTGAGIAASFATYGVGFLARPLGGLFFGSLGDRHGRKMVLVATILLMGIASTLACSRRRRPPALWRRSCWCVCACCRVSAPAPSRPAPRR